MKSQLHMLLAMRQWERITLGVRQHWLPLNIFRRTPCLAPKHPEKVKSRFPELQVVQSNPSLAPTATAFAVSLYSDYNRRWKSNWIVNTGHLTQNHPFKLARRAEFWEWSTSQFRKAQYHHFLFYFFFLRFCFHSREGLRRKRKSRVLTARSLGS